MSGRIAETDIVKLRESCDIEQLIGEYVTLKNAGSGAWKGLCPFHDERSASFHVTPSRNLWYCFGCGEGGDIYTFLQKLEQLTFAEAVEKVAEKMQYQLTYIDGDKNITGLKPGQRTRLVAAHRDAAEYYRQQYLALPATAPAKQFLYQRDFSEEDIATFNIGYSPEGWDGLTQHLFAKGYTEEELILGGLSSKGTGGKVYDKFRGRLMWTITDLSGDPIGFGARKIHADDNGPKYLNTAETPLYKKSQVLYGIDRARKNIAAKRQVVVVEGYSDVMACHLAGIDTAVAACGTAFGEGHIKIVRRLLKDDDQFSGEVIYTFDGDAAGQKAALRAFQEDQRFTARTYAVIAPEGQDPCEVRLKDGNAGVQKLMETKIPLFEFAITTSLNKHDLTTANGRTDALTATAPLVAQIKDPVLRLEYVRLLSMWIGIDASTVRSIVQRELAKTKGTTSNKSTQTVGVDMDRATLSAEREVLKCLLQKPKVASQWYVTLEESAFQEPTHRLLFTYVKENTPWGEAGEWISEEDPHGWAARLLANVKSEEVGSLIQGLLVEPFPAIEKEDVYVTETVSRVLEVDAARRIHELKSRMQRLGKKSDQSEYGKLMQELFALENYRRSLTDPQPE